MSPAKILVVDDSENVRWSLSRLLRQEDIEAIEAEDGAAGLHLIQVQCPDVVLLDIRMPGMNGVEMLVRAKKLDKELPVILMTGFGDIRGAVEALKAGAFDYLTKPFDHPQVVRTVRAALAQSAFRQRRRSSGTVDSLFDIMGQSDAIRRLNTEIERVAATDFSVIIVGETGSGKEVVAHAIHRKSHRSSQNFVALDCGAIPDTLIESELFGHERGAFTGADRRQAGKFEAASGGTLFLDEITNLPLGMQSKLLRALQEKEIYRIGSMATIKVDTRVIAATNQDPQSGVAAKCFRLDLFHRLSEYVLRVPPLRQRREDIPLLASRFLDGANQELNKHVQRFPDEAIEAMLGYDWPGNVRELRNVVRRAVLLADDLVGTEHLGLPLALSSFGASDPDLLAPDSPFSLKEIVQRHTARVERAVLAQVLRQTRGNKAKAARILHIDYKTIHTKLREYGISNS